MSLVHYIFFHTKYLLSGALYSCKIPNLQKKSKKTKSLEITTNYAVL